MQHLPRGGGLPPLGVSRGPPAQGARPPPYLQPAKPVALCSPLEPPLLPRFLGVLLVEVEPPSAQEVSVSEARRNGKQRHGDGEQGHGDGRYVHGVTRALWYYRFRILCIMCVYMC